MTIKVSATYIAPNIKVVRTQYVTSVSMFIEDRPKDEFYEWLEVNGMSLLVSNIIDGQLFGRSGFSVILMDLTDDQLVRLKLAWAGTIEFKI